MKVIATCGPGIQLSNALARAGFEVLCFKGSGATLPGPGEQRHLSLFDTNDDLLDLLKQTRASHEIAAVFHVVALYDYRVYRPATHALTCAIAMVGKAGFG